VSNQLHIFWVISYPGTQLSTSNGKGGPMARFFPQMRKLFYMRDLFLSIFLIAGTYVCSAGFAFLLFRIFFPLKTKSLEAGKLTFTANKNKWRNTSTKSKVPLFSVSGKRDLVKISS
jgi:hypothetical protein